MKNEIQSGVNFLCHLIDRGNRDICKKKLKKFKTTLFDILKKRYKCHWYPEKPFKGSGFRCIRINTHYLDHLIADAAHHSNICTVNLHMAFPSEVTLWIDPDKVTYRIGTQASICPIYTADSNKPWSPKPVENKPPLATEEFLKYTAELY